MESCLNDSKAKRLQRIWDNMAIRGSPALALAIMAMIVTKPPSTLVDLEMRSDEI
jgi:hypothetical protein